MAASKQAAPGMKLVVQQVSSASLLIDNAEKFVHIRAGTIVHVSFMKNATSDHVQKAAKMILGAKLSKGKGSTEKSGSILDYGGDVMIIPQACMAGKLKNGGRMQYHDQIEKIVGEDLYNTLIYELAKGILGNLKKNSDLSMAESSCRTFVDGIEICDVYESSLENLLCPSNQTEEKEKSLLDTAFAKGRNGVLLRAEEGEGSVAQRLAFGTYGNRQGLNFSSGGPYTHVIEV